MIASAIASAWSGDFSRLDGKPGAQGRHNALSGKCNRVVGRLLRDRSCQATRRFILHDCRRDPGLRLRELQTDCPPKRACHSATRATLRCRRRASITIIAVAVIVDVGAASDADELLAIRHGDHQNALALVDERNLLARPQSQAFANGLGDRDLDILTKASMWRSFLTFHPSIIIAQNHRSRQTCRQLASEPIVSVAIALCNIGCRGPSPPSLRASAPERSGSPRASPMAAAPFARGPPSESRFEISRRRLRSLTCALPSDYRSRYGKKSIAAPVPSSRRG